jgi:hypothetical protein
MAGAVPVASGIARPLAETGTLDVTAAAVAAPARRAAQSVGGDSPAAAAAGD